MNHAHAKRDHSDRPRGYVGDLKTNRKVEWKGKIQRVDRLATAIDPADKKEIRRGDKRQWYFTFTCHIPKVNHKVRIVIIWDEMTPLHPAVVEHLRQIDGFSDKVFEWPHARRTLWREFHKIQQAAGIHLPCHGQHEHTPSCHLYGFHDCRRAFATMNEEAFSASALQRLMRHKSYTTTQKYINMAQGLNQSIEKQFVPDVLQSASAG